MSEIGEVPTREIVQAELGEGLFQAVEEFILFAFMGLPTDERVLDAVKEKVGEDRGAMLCVFMAHDLEEQQKAYRARKAAGATQEDPQP